MFPDSNEEQVRRLAIVGANCGPTLAYAHSCFCSSRATRCNWHLRRHDVLNDYRLGSEIMELPSISVGKWMYAFVAAGLGSVLSAQPAPKHVSGIVSYAFEPNPQEIKPKMYNWEIKLNEEDSKAGAYEIIQITRSAKARVTAANAVSDVLIPSNVILPGRVGAVNVNLVDFNLYIGDKTPHQNMGRRGNSGQPIIFSGIGTGNGASAWVVFPGANIEHVLPSVSGTRLSHGKLRLIQFMVSNDRGEQFQTDVILRRK